MFIVYVTTITGSSAPNPLHVRGQDIYARMERKAAAYSIGCPDDVESEEEEEHEQSIHEDEEENDEIQSSKSKGIKRKDHSFTEVPRTKNSRNQRSSAGSAIQKLSNAIESTANSQTMMQLMQLSMEGNKEIKSAIEAQSGLFSNQIKELGTTLASVLGNQTQALTQGINSLQQSFQFNAQLQMISRLPRDTDNTSQSNSK